MSRNPIYDSMVKKTGLDPAGTKKAKPKPYAKQVAAKSAPSKMSKGKKAISWIDNKSKMTDKKSKNADGRGTTPPRKKK
jgi:hypothetical protein